MSCSLHLLPLGMVFATQLDLKDMFCIQLYTTNYPAPQLQSNTTFSFSTQIISHHIKHHNLNATKQKFPYPSTWEFPPALAPNSPSQLLTSACVVSCVDSVVSCHSGQNKCYPRLLGRLEREVKWVIGIARMSWKLNLLHADGNLTRGITESYAGDMVCVVIWLWTTL